MSNNELTNEHISSPALLINDITIELDKIIGHINDYFLLNVMTEAQFKFAISKLLEFGIKANELGKIFNDQCNAEGFYVKA